MSGGVGSGDDWDDIEAEGLAARAANAGASKLGARPAAPGGSGDTASAYGGGGLSSMDDDPFADDMPGGSLELDLPSHHQAQSPRSVPASHPPASKATPSIRPDRSIPAPPPAVSSAPPGQPSRPSSPQSLRPGATNSFRPHEASIPPQSGPHSIQPRYPSTSADPASLIARFPSPPTKLHETPLYALHVFLRQYELRQDLASLRKRRSPDVPLYERAIHTHDARTFRLGVVLSCAIFTVATFLFFLPVILRFMRNS